MRTTKDRLRQALLFEIILFISIVPVLTIVLNQPATKVGILSIFFSLVAMCWNYSYNILFDKILLKMGKSLSQKSWQLRAVHAVLFEFGFAFITIPVVMLWYDYSLLQAIALDLAFFIIIPVYTFLFTWGYDLIVPIKNIEEAA
ncbi:MAG: PACE efflux transporter [Desulfotalea sp.]